MAKSGKKVRVAIIGLGFGAEFIPIYQNHPHAEMYAICQRAPEKLKQIGDAFGVEKRYTSYDEVLRDENVDAVHINTPIPDHAPMSLAALKATTQGATAISPQIVYDSASAVQDTSETEFCPPKPPLLS